MEPNMGQPKQYTPEEMAQLEKSRTISDAELLKGGAEYVVDERGEKRLHISNKQYLQESINLDDFENINDFDQVSQLLEELLKGELDKWNKGRVSVDPWVIKNYKLARGIERFEKDYPIIGISWLGKTEDERKMKKVLENDKKRFYKVDCGDGCCTSFVLRRDYWGDDKGRSIIEEIKQNNVKV